jgi:hypothetical protein
MAAIDATMVFTRARGCEAPLFCVLLPATLTFSKVLIL